MWSLPRHIQGGDAGEFATVLLRGGVPHPSGYPWMRALRWPAHGLEVLGVSPVIATAVVPATAGVLAWSLLADLLARLHATMLAVGVVLVSGCSSLAVVHVFDCEVWGPQLLFGVFILRAAWHPTPRPLACGLWLGLGTSHHLAVALLIPLVAVASWQPTAPHRMNVMRLGRTGLGGLVGLLPFATLALGADGAWRWGDTTSLPGLVAHMLRFDYGALQLGLHEATPPIWALWSRVVTSLGANLTGGLLISPWSSIALLASLAALAKPPRAIARRSWWALYATVGVTTFAFPSLHNIDPSTPFARWILERFDLVPLLLWTVLATAALERLAGNSRGRRIAAASGVLVLLVIQLLRTHGRGVASDEAGVEHYARDVLATPTSTKSIVFGTDDHRTFPILFAQEVLGLGTDVLYVDAELMHHDWYRARLQRKWPGFPDVDKPLRAIRRLWAAAETRDTAVYLTNIFSRPAQRQLELVPEGVLWRVVPPHTDDSMRATFTANAITQRHLDACSRYGANVDGFAGLRHPGPHPWSADLWYAYRDGTAALARWHDAAGRRKEAAAVRSAGSRFSSPAARATIDARTRE